MLLGNKSDKEMQRSVSWREAEEYALKRNMVYLETSVINNINIQEAFNGLVLKLLKNMEV